MIIKNDFFIGIMNRTFVLCVLLILFALPASGNTFEVKNDNGEISVNVDNVNIEEVFNEIAQKFNIKVKIYPEMKKIKLSAHFQGLSLEKGIKTLVRENHAFYYDNQKLTRVYVLNKGKDFNERNFLLDQYFRREFFSMDQLKKLLLNNIQQKNSKADLIDVISHENIKGDLLSYLFLFYLGEGLPPTSEQIKSQVKDAWEHKKDVLKKIREAEKTKNFQDVNFLYQQLNEYKHLIRQNNNYLSVEVSADYEHPPIKSFYKGIPYDYAMLPNAMDLLNEKNEAIDSLQFTFERTFKLSLQAIGFEFKDKNNQRYYVDVLNKTVFTQWREKNKTQNTHVPTDNHKRIEEQWMQLIGY